MSSVERRQWAERVISRLDEVISVGARVLVLAGIPYRELLESFLADRKCDVVVPMKGLGIGRQLRWLKEANASKPLRSPVVRVGGEGG